MIKLILCGCFGRMGKVIQQLAAQAADMEVVAGIDIIPAESGLTFPTYSDIGSCNMTADAVVSFLPPTAVGETLAIAEYCVSRKIPLVLCTTGLSADVETAIRQAAEKVAILQSANMSLGINLLSNMLAKASRLLYDSGFDIEIIEKHHNQKLDAPSGTALLLGNTINNALGGNMNIINGRSNAHKKRARDEIGVHALRGGSIVGEHSVIFAGLDEIIEFTHIAQSRDAFAVGALQAVRFIKGKPAGLFTMQDLIEEI
ncbi:MAG: 4-hydroxy-tetrahydrodipicolinate reductase [Defluviitaleaceae bacterium]|nr:4-hydroxy-tetrahydrodipicolinate reductase [Defluviitaleaceae bacterium]